MLQAQALTVSDQAHPESMTSDHFLLLVGANSLLVTRSGFITVDTYTPMNLSSPWASVTFCWIMMTMQAFNVVQEVYWEAMQAPIPGQMDALITSKQDHQILLGLPHAARKDTINVCVQKHVLQVISLYLLFWIEITMRFLSRSMHHARAHGGSTWSALTVRGVNAQMAYSNNVNRCP